MSLRILFHNAYNAPEKRGGTYSVRAIAQNGALSPLNGEAYTLNADAMRQLLNPTEVVGPSEKKDCAITLSCSPAEGGTATVSAATVKEGEKIDLKATPNDGYKFKN